MVGLTDTFGGRNSSLLIVAPGPMSQIQTLTKQTIEKEFDIRKDLRDIVGVHGPRLADFHSLLFMTLTREFRRFIVLRLA
jgi:hypothetical protein